MENIENKSRILDKKEQEILEILTKADDVKHETLLFDAEGDILTVDEIKQVLVPSDTDDPIEKYNMFYQGIQRLLKRGLPKGKMYKDACNLVREEINTFLSRGKTKKGGRRGADSRMAYLTDMSTALDAIIEWTENQGSAVDLYQRFKDLNKMYQAPANE
jgi:hypothetical protein